MFLRAVRVAFACGVVAAAAAPACGGSSSNSGDSSAAAAGGAGAGGSGPGAAGKSSGAAGKAGSTGIPAPVPCGDQTCRGVSIPLAQLEVPGCCADAKTNTCGVDTSALPAMASGPALPACQPVAADGKPDATCASSPAIPFMGVTVTAPGCCTPSGVCGFDLNKVGGVISLGLGCVDSTPFVDGGTPVTCGPNMASGGGMGGAGPEQTAGGGRSGSAGSGA